jgi:urease accessory protein
LLLPLETILFGGSRAAIDTKVELEPGARFIGWEQTSLGRPLSGDHYATGSLDQRTRIGVAGEAQLIERLRFDARDRLLQATWGLATFGAYGALYAYPADDRLLAHVRERLGAGTPSFDASVATPSWAASDLRVGATLLGQLLVVRCLAHEPEVLRNLFETLWGALRPTVLERAVSAPRVWRT